MAGRGILARARRAARRLKRQLWALWLALGDPATPFAARAVIIVAVAYALSPLDLIPDFVPVLGQLDDLLILPLLVALALRLIPPEVRARTRREAWRRSRAGERIASKAGYAASVFVGLVWAALAAALVLAFVER